MEAMENGAAGFRGIDFNEKPFIAIWEVTQACDLACVHCRACAAPFRAPGELSTREGMQLIDEIAEMEVPLFVLTGGDPLKRPDLYELVTHATNSGLKTSLTPSATPLLTRDAVTALQRCGLARLAVSLDGSSAEIHDSFRGVHGSYERTLDALRWARELGLPTQINTTVTRRNLEDFDRIAALLEGLGIALWSVFFLVPTGRGSLNDLLGPEEFERVFARLDEIARGAPFDIKTTEAQHYRRYVLERRARESRQTGSRKARGPVAVSGDGIGRAPRGINDGKGFVFVSHLGDVFPSGFLPLRGGNVREDSLAEIYRHSPLFVALRDSSKLKGKCGVCEFREICGGSRSRAYAITGDPFAEEPCCNYQPGSRRAPHTAEVAAGQPA
jgi:AdoMet-dependent heme synthase